MVMLHQGVEVLQSQQAYDQFRSLRCYLPFGGGACDQPAWPAFGLYGFTSQRTQDGMPLSFEQLKNELDNNRYVAFTWNWKSGGQHMMVATGYKVSNGENYVTVNNPWPPLLGDTMIIPYSEYVSGSDHTHSTDFYQIEKR